MNVLPEDDSVQVVTNNEEYLKALVSRRPGQGLFCIETLDRDNCLKFTKILEETDDPDDRSPLKLICVDPLSAINTTSLSEPLTQVQLRARTLDALDTLKSQGNNILLVIEESNG